MKRHGNEYKQCLFLRYSRSCIAMMTTVCVMASMPGLFVAQASEFANPGKASIGDLVLRVDHVIWLDNQMDHGYIYPMPSSMMPDMPEHGSDRLSVEITLYNETQGGQQFQLEELNLRTNNGKIVTAIPTVSSHMVLSGKQRANLLMNFDVQNVDGQPLQLWRKIGVSAARQGRVFQRVRTPLQ